MRKRRERSCEARQHTVLRIGHHVEVNVEALQKPHDDGRDEDDGKRLLQKVLRLFPQQLRNVARAGQTVVGQLHDKRRGHAPEQRFLVEAGDQDAGDDAQQVQSGHDQPAVAREEGGDEERIERHFRRAAHKRRQQDGHLTVALAGQCPGGHYRGNRTAKTDQHRNDASA